MAPLERLRKVRRSLRLERRGQVPSQHTGLGPLGHLGVLPLEIKYHILNYLSVSDLSKLTITSKSLRNTVEDFRSSKCPYFKRKRVSPHTSARVNADREREVLQYYSSMGLLFKRSTCLYTTRERLRMIDTHMLEYLCLTATCCRHSATCQALVYFGHFLKTVLAGWDDSECQKALMTLCSNIHVNVARWIGLIVKSKPGCYPSLEVQVRFFLRRVFLDPYDRLDERSMWLTKILDNWPMVNQARIVYLLYGPANAGLIRWNEMCESTAADAGQLYGCFTELGTAFQVLYLSKRWTDDDVISVIDEVTTLPEAWLVENVASLLYMCGYDITHKCLASKILNARYMDVATIVTSLCLVYTKLNLCLGGVVSLVTELSRLLDTNSNKSLFIGEIGESFKEIFFDLFEFDDSEGDRLVDLNVLLNAYSSFMKELMSSCIIGEVKIPMNKLYPHLADEE